jgi:hypothetical protein
VSEIGSWSWLKIFALVLYAIALVLIPVYLGAWGADTHRNWAILLAGLIFALMLSTGTWMVFRD